MIVFESVTYSNFLSAGNTPTTINLNTKSTTLVTGVNGAGKTTFIDAVTFGLFGKSYRKINKPQLVNSINKRDCMVEIKFRVQADQYLLKRGINPDIFEIYKNGNKQAQDGSVRDYQAWLEQYVLRMSYATFCQVIVLGSANYVPFMQLQAWQRREVIENLLDIGVFSTMNTLLRERINAWDAEKLNLKGDEKVIGAKLSAQKELAAEIQKGRDKELAAVQKELDELKQRGMELLAKEKELNDLAETKKPLAAKVDDLRVALMDQVKFVGQLQTFQAADESRAKFFQQSDTCQACAQKIEPTHKHEQIATLEEAIRKWTADVAAAQRTHDEIEVELKEAMKAEAELKDIRNKQVGVRTSLRHVGEQGKKLTTKLKSLSESVKLEDIEAAINKLKEDLVALDGKKANLAEQGEALDVLQRLLKDNGIKASIIRQYVPVINTIINKYLAMFEFYVKFEFNENFEEQIKSRGRDEFTYNSFSMGERMRIDLALLFAWREVTRVRAQANTNILVFDEIFDSSLDAEGADALMNVLNEIAENTSVFVISHRADQLVDKMNNHLQFEKIKGFSRLVAKA